MYTATLSIVSVRSKGDEVRASDSTDNSCHWSGISMIPTSPTDVSQDAEPEPGATVKSLVKSFDTVGQSEHLNRTQTLAQTVKPTQQRTAGEICT